MPQPAAAPTAPASGTASDPAQRAAAAELAFRSGDWQAAIDSLMALAREQGDASHARRAAEIAVASGAVADNVAATRLWFELDPGVQSVDAYARAALAAGDSASAAAALGQLAGRASDASRDDALFHALGLLSRHAQDEEGARLLEQLAAPYADEMAAQVLLSEAARWRGEREAALAHARRAVEIDGGSPAAALALSRLSQGKEELAVMARYLKANPDVAQMRYEYGIALARHGRLDDARRELSRVLEKLPDHPDTLFALASVEQQAGRDGAVQRHLARLVELDAPNKNRAIALLAAIALEKDDTAQAMRWIGQVDNGRDATDARIVHARVLAAQGDVPGARRVLAAIRPASPAGEVDVVIAEAQLLEEAGQPAEAFALLQAALQRFPDDADLRYQYAMTAEQAGDFGAAEKALRELLAMPSPDAHVYNALGYLLADRNMNLAEARRLIATALRLEPGNDAIVDSMGWLEYRSGRLKAAEKLLRKAWGMRKDAEIGAHLGEVLWKAGKKSQAKAILREALRLDADNRVVRDTIARLGVKL